ncbi:hypothetical protein V8F33_003968 [Rhypophila sp. PSN 637]
MGNTQAVVSADNRPRYNLDNCQLSIIFYPKLNLDYCQDWQAMLLVQCHDLPRLMREGFHWSESNVVPSLGHYEPVSSEDKKVEGMEGMEYMRTWTLLEHPGNKEKCQWSAHLAVLGRSIDIISKFRPGQLSKDNIQSVEGEDSEGKSVFHYWAWEEDDEDDINCIYDHLQPRFGSWWFWPEHKMKEKETAPPLYGPLNDDNRGDKDRDSGTGMVRLTGWLKKYLVS